MTGRPVDRRAVFGEPGPGHYPERIAPGHFPRDVEAAHVARYRWAARWVRGARVLDVASGTGYGARVLRRAGARSVASVDLSAEALGFGKASYALRAVRADAHDLPFRTGSFDAVVSLETIEHLDRPERFLQEARRVLRAGGHLLLSTPNGALVSSADNPYHRWELTLQDLARWLAGAGFRLAAVHGQHWRTRLRAFRSVPGLRRLAWEAERRARVLTVRPPLADPQDWCLAATALP